MSTGIGILSGLALLIAAVVLGGGFKVFLNLEAFMITLGGTAAATLISFPLARVLKFFSLVVRLFKREEHEAVLEQTVSRLVMLGHKAQRHSVYSLEKDAREEKNRYVKAGLQLLIEGATAPRIARRFAIEMEGVRSRHQEGIQLFSFMSRIAPSLGLVGTLIGMIHMLRILGHDAGPEVLGASMAVAMVATLYGCLFSFLLFLPASEKLKAYSAQELTLIAMVREAMLLIREGQTSREMEETLNAYLPPKRRHPVVEKILLSSLQSNP